MKQMYVYILLCSDNTYYTGVTNDVERRFMEHQSGENKGAYTYIRRPVKLVFSEMFIDANEAIQAEKQIKKWSRKKKEALINRQWDLLPLLSKKNFKK